MVLQLSPDRGVRDLSLAGGDVIISVTYADMVTRTAAKNKAQAKIRQLKDGGEVLEELGYNSDHWDALLDVDILAGLAELWFAVELGHLIIQGWKGVETPDGDIVPINHESIVAVMKHIGSDFINEEARTADKMVLEGNVFSPFRNGNGAGAGTIAKAAKPKTPPAPMESADLTDNDAPS